LRVLEYYKALVERRGNDAQGCLVMINPRWLIQITIVRPILYHQRNGLFRWDTSTERERYIVPPQPGSTRRCCNRTGTTSRTQWWTLWTLGLYSNPAISPVHYITASATRLVHRYSIHALPRG